MAHPPLGYDPAGNELPIMQKALDIIWSCNQAGKTVREITWLLRAACPERKWSISTVQTQIMRLRRLTVSP